MTTKLPKRTTEHVTGDQGSRILQHSIPGVWVYRDLEGKGDYGIDAEIEIFDGEVPSGLSFRAQIRSHSGVAWNARGEYVQAIDQSTRNYWRLQATPVLVIVCDVQTRAAYWAFADEGETQSGVRVSRACALPGTVDVLRKGLTQRLNMLGPSSLLLMAPLLDRDWSEIEGSTGGDSFLPIDDELLLPLKMIYAHIPFLRYALALPPAALVPWDVWVAKSQMAFSDYYEIYWLVFDEMIEYLRPIVAETLDAAARRLSSQDALTGDVSAINWSSRRLGRNVSYAYGTSLSRDKRFWEEFDTYLAGRGVRRFSAVEAYERRHNK